jgi:hypothetical protein
MRQWTFLLGPGLIPGINALFLGYVMYRSRLVPRLIPAIGLAGLDFSWAWQARGLNYNLVISIMVCLFVGRVVVRLSRRCAGFHAPAGVLS